QGAREREAVATVVPAGGWRTQRGRAQCTPGPQPVGAVTAFGAAAPGRACGVAPRSAGGVLLAGPGTGGTDPGDPARDLLRSAQVSDGTAPTRSRRLPGRARR